MKNKKKTARVAGLYYLLVVVLSILYMEFIPSKIVVQDDPIATMHKLLSHASLFKWGILIGIAVHISFILLPLTLYKLLHHINNNLAIIMVVFALISVPISYTFLYDQFEIIPLINDYPMFDMTQKQEANAKVFLMYENLYSGFFLLQIFWGLWLFPLGYLAFKSGFLPKVLGIFLMLGCISYLIDVVGGILLVNFHEYVNTHILIIPAAIGEIGMCFWLLTIGVKADIKF